MESASVPRYIHVNTLICRHIADAHALDRRLALSNNGGSDVTCCPAMASYALCLIMLPADPIPPGGAQDHPGQAIPNTCAGAGAWYAGGMSVLSCYVYIYCSNAGHLPLPVLASLIQCALSLTEAPPPALAARPPAPKHPAPVATRAPNLARPQTTFGTAEPVGAMSAQDRKMALLNNRRKAMTIEEMRQLASRRKVGCLFWRTLC